MTGLEQDGTQLSPEEVSAYLRHASLADYAGGLFREQALLPEGWPTPPGTFTHYTAHLLPILALKALGYERWCPSWT